MSKIPRPKPKLSEGDGDFEFAVQTLRDLVDSDNDMVRVRAAEALARLVKKQQAPEPESSGEMTHEQMSKCFFELARYLVEGGTTLEELHRLIDTAKKE
jgi:hypothetical protein